MTFNPHWALLQIMTQKRPHIFRSPNSKEYWMEERIYVQENMNSPDEPDVSMATCRIQENVTTQLHSLNITEWYIILNGDGLLEIDGENAVMKAGDCVKINPGQRQRITNTGKTDLIFTSICRPRFKPESYTNLELEKKL